MKKLQISRARWLRGEGSPVSKLLRESDKKMCCLGFLALDCNATEDQILRRHSVDDTPGINWPHTIKDTRENTYDCLMKTNDDSDISEKSREEKIISLFKNLDYEVEFIP